MPTDWLVVGLVAVVALVVASNAARRAGEQADRRLGGTTAFQAHRHGPLGPTLDLIDASVALYAVRSWLGRPTATRAEGRTAEARAAAMAQAEAIRRSRRGLPPVTPPRHLVVAGTASSDAPLAVPGATVAPDVRARSTFRLEVGAAVLGVLAVVGVILALGPRTGGGVLVATGTPGSSGPAATDAVVVPFSSGLSPGEAPEPGTSPSVAAPAATTSIKAPPPVPGAATPTPTRTTRAAGPTAKPAGTPRPASTPRPTVAPTPTAVATPEPTPSATPEPTPEPTAVSSPESTPLASP